MEFDGTILALDSAKRTGIAEGIPGQSPNLTFVDFGGRELDDDADVFARAYRWITRRIESDPPGAIALETPVPMYDSSMVFGLRGVFLGVARAHGVKVVEARVAEWRKYFLGVGNLKGPIAKRESVRLCRMLGWDLPRRSPTDLQFDHNAAEAGGLWLWACGRLAPTRTARHEPLFLPGSAP